MRRSSSMVFPDTWFIPVSVERVLSTPIWINPDYETELKNVCILLDDLSSQKSFPAIEPFRQLGVRTKLFSDPFVSYEDWKNFQSQVIYLKTERFFDPYSLDIGSGRNAILGHIQYKGIGRNSAAARKDWLHSWGGVRVEESLQEIFFERLLHSISPRDSVPIYGVFLYDDCFQSFLIRSSNAIRCEQVRVALQPQEYDSVINYLSSFFSGIEKENWHSTISQRFIQLMRKGVFHQSPTLENLTIDGRFIDHHSIEKSVYQDSDPGFFCEVIVENNIEDPSLVLDLERLFTAHKVRAVQTNFDFLAQQILAIKTTYDWLKLPTLKETEVVELMTASFPKWSHFIKVTKNRETIFLPLLVQLVHEGEATVTLTDQGSIIIEVGRRMRREVYSMISRLTQFKLQSLPYTPREKFVKELEAILRSVSVNLFAQDFFGHDK